MSNYKIDVTMASPIRKPLGLNLWQGMLLAVQPSIFGDDIGDLKVLRPGEGIH
jgi:hypothetical protein